MTASDGHARLKIRVRAAPDKGAANTAVIKLLAKALGVPKTSLSLISGQTARMKTVHAAELQLDDAKTRLLGLTGPS